MGRSQVCEASRVQKEEETPFLAKNQSMKIMDFVYCSLSPLLAVYKLAHSSPWLQTLNCNFLCCAVLCLVTQSCLILCDPIDRSLPGSSVHGILQARILEWVAIPFSRGSSWPKDWTQVCTAGRFFIIWVTGEAHCWVFANIFTWVSPMSQSFCLFLISCPCSICDSSSLTRDWTLTPYIGSLKS